MLGFQGTELTEDLRALVKTYHPGGVLLFSRNLTDPEQAARLTNALQKLTPKMPLLVAIDQEGGRVARLPKGFTVFPGQGTLGRAGTVSLAYSFAEVTARELRAIGVNMNLAPVLDVNTNPENPVIGDRAFGHEGAVADDGIPRLRARSGTGGDARSRRDRRASGQRRAGLRQALPRSRRHGGGLAQGAADGVPRARPAARDRAAALRALLPERARSRHDGARPLSGLGP